MREPACWSPPSRLPSRPPRTPEESFIIWTSWRSLILSYVVVGGAAGPRRGVAAQGTLISVPCEGCVPSRRPLRGAPPSLSLLHLALPGERDAQITQRVAVHTLVVNRKVNRKRKRPNRDGGTRVPDGNDSQSSFDPIAPSHPQPEAHREAPPHDPRCACTRVRTAAPAIRSSSSSSKGSTAENTSLSSLKQKGTEHFPNRDTATKARFTLFEIRS